MESSAYVNNLLKTKRARKSVNKWFSYQGREFDEWESTWCERENLNLFLKAFPSVIAE